VPQRPAASAPASPGELTRIPFRGVRKTIAARLRESVNTAVHFNVMDEADVSTLDAVRKRTAASSGEKLSFLPFVVSAVCKAFQSYPSLNATVDDDAGEILRHRAAHIGIAADTDHGLTVPVMFDTDRMGVLQIAREIENLARMTRDRSIPRDQLMGSTFTISNVGSYAGRFATPIINYPEVAILGVGRVRDGVVVKDGMLKIAKIMPLSLAADHRVVDGAEAARFLQHVIDLLQAPEGLLVPARG
jgi:pyruvate dehydrogenase E2 component (dihydrolipoamide acetyltransferase)